MIANSAGTTVWRWDQGEPFGNDVPNNNPSGAGAFDFPLRFPGQYFDRETNLAYNYFRDYDPGTGRYVESDPIGLEGGLNTYGYALSTPVRYTDPTGKFVFLLPVIVIGADLLVDVAVAGTGLLIGGMIANTIFTKCHDDNNCQEQYVKCLHTSLAGEEGGVHGSSRCQLCRDACVRGGYWPHIAMTGGKSVRCDYWNW